MIGDRLVPSSKYGDSSSRRRILRIEAARKSKDFRVEERVVAQFDTRERSREDRSLAERKLNEAKSSL